MSHDLRLRYIHRHSYTFVRREIYSMISFYLFRCGDCEKHGLLSERLIGVERFWGSK